MADKLTYQLEGTKQILEAIDSLNDKEIFKLVKSVNRRNLTKNVVKPVRTALPYSAETKKAIKIVADRADKKTGLYAGVTSDAFWLRFVEGGTKVRTTEAGANRGLIAPNPRAKQTIDQSVPSVIDFFNKEFGGELVTMMQKKLKRINK